MRPTDLHGRRMVVLGVGIDVAAALPVVLAAGPAELAVVDADPARAEAALGRAGVSGVAVHARVEDAPPAEVALRSPGFSPYQPALRARIDAGLATVTPLGLWLAERGRRPAVAITGTKGKSSTSVLTAIALERLGQPTTVLGNIGVPPWDRAPTMTDVAVLEISSYQAVDLPVTAPIAALTAIGEDHVDWHGSVEQYLADKARVFTVPTTDGRRWCGVPDAVALPAAFAGIDFTRVPVPDGDLRASNARVAAAVALAATGADPLDAATLGDLADALLAEYPDLPGRLATVATIGDVAYVDDALASNPLGLAAALRSLDQRLLAVIVGGTDRGAAVEPVLDAIAGRSSTTVVICIDDAAALVERYRAVASATVVVADLEAAVVAAAEAAEGAGGGTVLFSPGMPTPSGQGSWVDRSARYRAAVARLAGGDGRG